MTSSSRTRSDPLSRGGSAGDDPQRCASVLRNTTTYGMMMVKQGDADGLLGGLATPYADTIRPALKVLGKAANVSDIQRSLPDAVQGPVRR